MKINPIILNKNYNFKYSKAQKSEKMCENFNYTSSLQCLANQNISFCAKKPVYAMGKDFKLIYFDSAQRASLILGVNDSAIASVLKGRNHLAGDYAFAYASELEIENKDGKKELSPDAVERLKENFKNAKTVPTYILDYDGNLTRCDTQTLAARALKTTLKVVNKAACGYAYVAKNHIVIPADEIELKDDNGDTMLGFNSKPLLNYEKVRLELAKFSNTQFAPVCTVDYLGNIQRFNNKQELIDEKDVSLGTVSSCLNSGKPTRDKIIVYENDILFRDEFGKTRKDINGNYIYDLSKINKRLQVFADSKLKPIRVKDVKGDKIHYYYFDHGQHAAEQLGITKQMVSRCLKQERPWNGYYFEYMYPTYLDKYTIASN